MYFLGFVSLVDVCPASSEHPLSPRGYELLSLSSTLSIGENSGWQRMRSFYARLLLSYCMHVWLTAIVGTSHSACS